MIKVYQTKFGGIDVPDEEKGNCFQAALASILELPVENCFHIWDYSTSTWFEELTKWLSEFNLVMVGFDVSKSQTLPFPIGYHLIDAESATLKNGELHTLVGYNGEVVHDPNPNAKEVGKFVNFWLFAEISPTRKG
jgi:hypothetical protein